MPQWLSSTATVPIKGTLFKVVKVAPLGDPVEITVRGYELSIRKEEAAIVEVV